MDPKSFIFGAFLVVALALGASLVGTGKLVEDHRGNGSPDTAPMVTDDDHDGNETDDDDNGTAPDHDREGKPNHREPWTNETHPGKGPKGNATDWPNPPGKWDPWNGSCPCNGTHHNRTGNNSGHKHQYQGNMHGKEMAGWNLTAVYELLENLTAHLDDLNWTYPDNNTGNDTGFGGMYNETVDGMNVILIRLPHGLLVLVKEEKAEA